MLLNFKIFIYNLFFIHIKIWWLLHCNPLVRSQLKNTASIPVVIINFNQLFYLRQLVDFLKERKFENIVIIDNLSTYPPLLDYYKALDGVKVEYMDKNYGHMVFFERENLQKKYGQGFYIVTDADVVPSRDLPENFMKSILKVLIKEYDKVIKVGLALKTDDIPESYPFKEQVIHWERKFWQEKYQFDHESYHAKIDTTFALYKPGYPTYFNNCEFLKGIRLAGQFTARHGGWYVDPLNLTDEQKYYQKSSTSASSWLIREDGSLHDLHKIKYFKN